MHGEIVHCLHFLLLRVLLWTPFVLWAPFIPVSSPGFGRGLKAHVTLPSGEGVCTDVSLDCKHLSFPNLAVVLFLNIDSSSSQLTSVFPHKVWFTFTL